MDFVFYVVNDVVKHVLFFAHITLFPPSSLPLTCKPIHILSYFSIGVRIFADKDLPPGCSKAEAKKVIEDDLKGVLTGLAVHLFGDVEMRWREDYFPFTEPSFELDIFFNNDWMEVLGCGVIHDEVMANANQPPGTTTIYLCFG